MTDWTESYPAVYRALAPDYGELSQSEVEQILQGVFGESADLQTVESFLGDVGKAFGSAGRAIGNVAQQAAPVLLKAGSGALSGAMAGAALGPYGMIAGGLIGGTAGALSSGGGHRSPSAPPAGAGVIGQVAGAASGLFGRGGGAAGAIGQLAGIAPNLLAGQGPTGAVGQFMGALASPTVQQALLSMLLGSAGNRAVVTPGGTMVPVAAITNLLAMLAHRASAEWEAITPFGEADYLTEEIDTASPEARAAWLYDQLAPIDISAPSDDEVRGSQVESSPATDPETVDESWIDEMYDELEAEFYAND